MKNPQYRHLLRVRIGNNIVDPLYVDTGKAWVSPDFNKVDSTTLNAFGILPVRPGTTYFASVKNTVSNPIINIYYFSKSGRLLGSGAGLSQFTTPNDCYFIRGNFRIQVGKEGLCIRTGSNVFEDYFLTKQVAPVYKDDLSKEVELETNQRFFRSSLSGKLSFVGSDFDFIKSRAFDDEFIHVIEDSLDLGSNWSVFLQGKFMRTDCTIDEDDKKITVQPKKYDQYNDVVAGLEKEYDLIKLTPQIDPLIIQKRPLIQVYIPGDSVVSCFLGGNYWEQDAEPTTNLRELEEKYYFALCNMLKEINITMSNGANPSDANGLYTGRMSVSTDGGATVYQGILQRSGDTKYQLRIVQAVFGQGGRWNFGQMVVELVRVSDGLVFHRYSTISQEGNSFDSLDFTMTAVNGTGTAAAEMSTYRIYARYVLDVEQFMDLNTYPIPSDDIVENNRNFRRVIGYAISIGYISMNFSQEPTEFGKSDNGLYFIPPYSIFGQKFYPIARSTWRYASIWFGFDVFDWIVEEQGRKSYVLRDCYPIASVINVLLSQFAPGIDHKELPAYSEFFYNGNNPVSYQKFRVMITQKSNVLVGDYDQPAQKAPITLQQVTDMLWNVYRCKWHIENGKFRIEHISWYRNGGTYSGIEQVQFDLTTLQNVRNKKYWGFHSSAYEFDKIDLAERFQFKWMDDVTEAFEGQPIQVLSKYVTEGKVEDVNVSQFTTDVDYMLLNPGDVSKDGFALFSAVPTNGLVKPDDVFSGSTGTAGQNDGLAGPFKVIKSGVAGKNAIARFTGIVSGSPARASIYFLDNGYNRIGFTQEFDLPVGQTSFNMPVSIPEGTVRLAFRLSVGTATFRFGNLEVSGIYELPFVNRFVNGADYILQNGYASFITLQPNYFMDDLPATRVLMNGEETTAFGIEKKKKQNVTFPSLANVDPMKLVKTYIGNGQIDKISINLHSRMNKITLKYDTEQ